MLMSTHIRQSTAAATVTILQQGFQSSMHRSRNDKIQCSGDEFVRQAASPAQDMNNLFWQVQFPDFHKQTRLGERTLNVGMSMMPGVGKTEKSLKAITHAQTRHQIQTQSKSNIFQLYIKAYNYQDIVNLMN